MKTLNIDISLISRRFSSSMPTKRSPRVHIVKPTPKAREIAAKKVVAQKKYAKKVKEITVAHSTSNSPESSEKALSPAPTLEPIA